MIHLKYNASSRYLLIYHGNVLDLGCSSTVASSSPTPSFLAEYDHIFFLLMLVLRSKHFWSGSSFKWIPPLLQLTTGLHKSWRTDNNQKEQPPFSESPRLCWLGKLSNCSPEAGFCLLHSAQMP